MWFVWCLDAYDAFQRLVVAHMGQSCWRTISPCKYIHMSSCNYDVFIIQENFFLIICFEQSRRGWHGESANMTTHNDHKLIVACSSCQWGHHWSDIAIHGQPTFSSTVAQASTTSSSNNLVVMSALPTSSSVKLKTFARGGLAVLWPRAMINNRVCETYTRSTIYPIQIKNCGWSWTNSSTVQDSWGSYHVHNTTKAGTRF